MKRFLFLMLSLIILSLSRQTAYSQTVVCDVNNLDPVYKVGSSVPRPNALCPTNSNATAGAASFSVSGSAITGWNSPGGTHSFYNEGRRTVTLSSLACGGTTITLNPPITCGSFDIVAEITAPVENAAVDLSKEAQAIRGFGGMNHPVWAGDLTAPQRETVFGNGDNQLGFTVLRMWVSDNTNQWSQELATAKKAVEHGAIVFASPWNPPSSMTETFTRNGENAKRLKAGSYAAYATHLNDFVTYMKNNGVDLYAISVQNEPDYAHDWTWWTAAEIVTFLKNNAKNINCKIMAPESFQYVKGMSDPILNDAAALAQVDVIGAHLYGTQYSAFPYPLFKQKGAGKELWMTEVYYPNSSSSADAWPEALEVAQHIHSAMADAEFQAYVWWYIRRSYSPMKEDGTISKRGYMMAHFSKFVRPGYVRVDATKNPNMNVYVSAYKGDGKVVIVAVNKQASAINQNFVISGADVESVERWVTSQNQNLAKGTDIDITNGRFAASLPAQSVTTFLGVVDSGPPTSIGGKRVVRNYHTTPLVTIKGRTLNVNSPTDSKVRVRLVNMTGKTVANFSASGNAKLSLKQIPAGAYIIEARRVKDGYRMTSSVMLR